jgi:predicted nucleic acid-binding Zn ribbon protein
VNPVRDDGATTTCPVCGVAFEPEGRQLHCSTRCRQRAWRRRRSAPVEPLVARVDTVYVCPDCDARYLGQQRCDDCNTWCRRLGPGGFCPCCDEPIAISDLFEPDQLANTPSTARRRKVINHQH